ncbi:Eco57I restriction-modification methylase domain-containing protein [Leptolyngbya sp. AN03gr2]
MLPGDLLQRIVIGDKNLDGLSPTSYHLLEGEKLNEAINRSWNRLRGAWVSFQAALKKLPEHDLGTSVTRDRFLLPLFQELGYGRLAVTRAVEIEGKNYPISHRYQHTPIHLVGWGVNLDKRTAGAMGAARSSPHSLVQEFLNRSDAYLWAFVCNGRKLRTLRDNISLTRQSFVEFDLEAMMSGEVYADFVVLWLLCHQSRVESEVPKQCWLERWSQTAQEQGTRALEQLRDGVEAAITALGQGFLSHPYNRELRQLLQTGELTVQNYYHQLRRLVYRLLFLFVVEDRDALLDPTASLATKERYIKYYSTTRLRSLADRMRGTRHSDLFHSLRVVVKSLGGQGCPELGLPALGSFLWSEEAIAALESCQIANSALLDAVRSLAFITDQHGRRPVDYKNLRSRELGSIYESLLELHPEINSNSGTFALKAVAGNHRKTTGCYYTPENLVQCLLDSALNPVLEEACRQSNPEAAILNLKVCDTACGSGHFLTAAAHRMAKRLAAIRTGEEEPAPEAIRTALRQVIGRCIYGVDVNRMAVELCKVALWMEAMEPGKPLPFLEHHIQWGNSLIGATPALMAQPIPDVAFNPIKGDDKAICSKYKKQNKKERSQGQLTLVDPSSKPWGWLEDIRVYAPEQHPWQQLEDIAAAMKELDQIPDDSIAQVRLKQQRYQTLLESSEYRFSRFRSDAWCAAFVWKKTEEFDYAITDEIFQKIKQNPYNAPEWMGQEVERLREQYQFFHWHVAFAHIFQVPKHEEEVENNQMGWVGGFDVELGNTPWERITLQERAWFSAYRPDISNAVTASERKRKIQALQAEDPYLYAQFMESCRQAEGESHFLHQSGRFPLCGKGDINTYAVFAETNRLLLSSKGLMGCIVPSALATTDTTKFFFQDLMNLGSLVSFYDFENRERTLFPDIDSRMRFALVTLSGSDRPTSKGDFVFFAHRIEDLDLEERHINLTIADIALLNPHTKTCPIFRTRQEFAIAKQIYTQVPVLGHSNVSGDDSWNIKVVQGLFDQTLDGDCLHQSEMVGETQLLRAYEARMIGLFNHRECSAATTDKNTFRTGVSIEITDAERQNPEFLGKSRYWASQAETERRIPANYPYQWFLGYKDVTSATNSRTMIACVIPKSAVLASIRTVLFSEHPPSSLFCLLANWNSFCFDFICRQGTPGNHLSDYILRQLPMLVPSTYQQKCEWDRTMILRDWILARVLELTYTAWDLQAFAKDCGYEGAPFQWDEERRFLLRCELDAAYFHLYQLQRDDVAFVMDTFAIIKRKDEQKYSRYRTQDTILSVYDAIAAAIRTGQPYQTVLDPVPADVRLAHPLVT